LRGEESKTWEKEAKQSY